MSTYNYDFRILIETLSGSRYSYGTGSFVQVSAAPVTMATSGAVDVITSMPSMSYYNAEHYTSSSLYINNIDTTRTFTQTKLQGSILGTTSNHQFLSASIKGNRGSGSILFEPNMEVAWTGSDGKKRDFLKRYKFFGNKVCNVLGIPENFWIYSDRFRLSNTGSQQNIIRGDVLGNSIHAKKNIAISNAGNFASDLPFHHAKNTDRWVKWTNTSGSVPQNDMLIGYSNLSDDYMIRMQNSKRLVMSGSNSDLEVQGFPNLNMTGRAIHSLQITSDNQSNGTLRIRNNSGIGTIENTYDDDLGNLTLQVNGFADAISIDRSAKSVGIGAPRPNSTLEVNGDFTATNITASGDISSSGIITSHTGSFGLVQGYMPGYFKASMSDSIIGTEIKMFPLGGENAIGTDNRAHDVEYRLIMPYDGYLEKLVLRNSTTLGETTLRFFKTPNFVSADLTDDGDISEDDTDDTSNTRQLGDDINFTANIIRLNRLISLGTDYAFSEGDIISLGGLADGTGGNIDGMLVAMFKVD